MVNQLSRKWMYGILVALCCIIYANSLQGQFVSDDIPGIVKSPVLHRPQDFIFSFPVLLYSFNFLLAGLNPWLYHFINLLLHALNSCLAFSLLAIFFQLETAFFGACLFAAHPVHVEAVAWISGRPYLTLGLFIFLTFLFYQRALQEKGKVSWRYYFFALALFSYNLTNSYAFFALFPFFLVLADLALSRCQRTWKLWLPFFLLLAIQLILVRAAITNRLHFVVKEMGLNQAEWTNPIYNMAYSLAKHTWLLLWPAKLTLYHEPAVISPLALKLALAGLVLSAGLAFFSLKKSKLIFFACALWVLFLAPTYSPVPFSWLVAERYLYFPAISLSIILAFLFEKYSQKCPNRKEYARVIFLCVIAAYAARSVARNEDWQSPGRLWRQTVAASPYSHRAHNNLADAFGQEGNTAGAIREFKLAIAVKPDYADAFHNLANTYEAQGSSAEAIENYLQAVKYNPGLFESHYNLGVIYLHQGNREEASKYLQRAKELRPDDKNTAFALELAGEK
jgi:tetratricopeptide (TPR) repeat protein